MGRLCCNPGHGRNQTHETHGNKSRNNHGLCSTTRELVSYHESLPLVVTHYKKGTIKGCLLAIGLCADVKDASEKAHLKGTTFARQTSATELIAEVWVRLRHVHV